MPPRDTPGRANPTEVIEKVVRKEAAIYSVNFAHFFNSVGRGGSGWTFGGFSSQKG